jgi:hypothetical protein
MTQIDRAQTPAGTIQHRQRGGGGLAVLVVVAQRHENAVAAGTQDGTMGTLAVVSFLQQGQHIIDLSLVRQRCQGGAKVGRYLAERGHRPIHAMFLAQQGQHGFLRVLGRPLADAMGQSGRGLAHNDAQTLLQGKDANQADAGPASHGS